MVRLSLAPLAALLLAAGPLACTALHLSPLSLSVTSSTGSTALAESLVHPRSLSEPVALEPQGALKLAFEVLDKEGGKGTSPHQAGLSFVDVESGKDIVLPVTVRPNGKAKFSLDTASLPLALRQTSGHLAVSLYLGAFDSASIAYRLFTLSLPTSTLSPPPSSKSHSEALFSTFTKLPELEWTFRADEPGVNPVFTAGGLALVLAPWVVLMAIASRINVSKRLQPSAGPFLLSLGFLEATTLAYWFSYLRLFRFLAIFTLGGIGALITGRPALRVLKQRPEKTVKA